MGRFAGYHEAMPIDAGSSDKPIIRLPLPGYFKWVVRAWVALLLLSPFLGLFRFSYLQIVVLAGILGGFALPFVLGRLPGELEAVSELVFFLNPRAHRYAWLYLLGQDHVLSSTRPRSFAVAETSLRWEAQRLSLDAGGDTFLLGQGAQMEPVRDWLVRRGVQQGSS